MSRGDGITGGENELDIEGCATNIKDTHAKKPQARLFSVFSRQSKTIYLIRHGHTTYKEGACRTKCGKYAFDVTLSQLGIEQACSLKEKLVCLGAELILTSPLTRALQTLHYALGMNEESSVTAGSVEVCDLHTEHVFSSGDVGRPASTLAEEFPLLSFSGLNEVWWFSPRGAPNDPLKGVFQSRENMGHLRKRVGVFRQFLLTRPESVIVVIGHSTFFKELIGKRKRMENCEIFRLKM